VVAQAIAGHGQYPAIRVDRDALDRPSGKGTLQRVGDRILGRGDIAGARGQ
jgi:hypothetical protein